MSLENGHMSILVHREAKQVELNTEEQKRRGRESIGDISGFTITDNGIGFNSDNMNSFRFLDSDYKASRGCKGIGRLLWLKAFSSVQVESHFKSDGLIYQRRFTFSAEQGITGESSSQAQAGTCCGTKLTLDGFSARYRKYTRKSIRLIAEGIYQHCLWYFIRAEGAPNIEVVDDGDRISLHEIHDEQIASELIQEDVDIKGRSFSLTHVRLRSNSYAHHSTAFCANNRLVKEYKLSGKMPGLFGALADEIGEFFYCCYVSSPVLDEAARPERTDFELLESLEGLELLAETDLITIEDIKSEVIIKAQVQLRDLLNQNLARARQRIEEFVSDKAPRYRPILSRIPADDLNIDPEISEKDLEVHLHMHLANIERELIKEGHDILGRFDLAMDDQEYDQALHDYLEKAGDIKKSDLASYVAHRRTIIDLFEKAIQKDPSGNYVREELIHKLIMPMGVDSTKVRFEDCNLWLVDERLAFHNYLASDQPINSIPVTGSDSRKEPDLFALNVFNKSILLSENPNPPLASIVIIEIKRPMRPDSGPGEEHDPIEQATGYLSRIRRGGVQSLGGRPIHASESIPGFCYILADLTNAFAERCNRVHDLDLTPDGMGFFGYKKNLNAYIEVISFDRLVILAKQRNRAFFEKLGIPAI